MRPLAIAGLIVLTFSAIACEHARVRQVRDGGDSGESEAPSEEDASADDEETPPDDAMQDEASEDAMQDEPDAAPDADAGAGDSPRHPAGAG